MAYENIEIETSNFCLTPQAGTFGTINNTDPTTIFRVKNTAGGLIRDYTLSSNILTSHEVLSVEYVGPLNLSGAIDDVTFFTLEKVDDTQCIIKRWELNTSLALLSLKQQIVKTTTGNYYYDAVGMSVEHYHREFSLENAGGLSYVDVNNSSKIATGHKLFLGPSTIVNNPGATETVTVSYVDGTRVYINGTTTYQYRVADPIAFYNNIYVISKKGYAGVETQGTIFKLDAYTGARIEYNTSGEYVNVTGSKWNELYQAVTVINGTQLLFINTYASYTYSRSFFLNNVISNTVTSYDVYDIAFDNFNLYKLSQYITVRDDDGNKSTYSWVDYNYQQDSLLPYTCTVTLFTEKSYMIGNADETTLRIQTRDQYNVGLRDVNINMYKDGDLGAVFDPLNGQAVTDINGRATIDYTSGSSYEGVTELSVRADKSSPFTGSEYAWNLLRILSEIEIGTETSAFTNKEHSGFTRAKQIYDPYKVTRYERTGFGTETDVPSYYIPSFSYFMNEGGWWNEAYASRYSTTYWPWFDVVGGRNDGPNSAGGGTWDWLPWADPDGGKGYSPRPNIISQVLDFTQNNAAGADDVHRALRVKQPKWFWVYSDVVANSKLEDGLPPEMYTKQIGDAEHDLQLSQLKLSKHTHYVDGDPYDYLWTEVSLDQFIFVEDAIPSFWSEKNARETLIWLRLRPFGFSLAGTTLNVWIREVWSDETQTYDTGYYNLFDLYGPPTDFIDPNDPEDGCTGGNPICIEYFDAGGGNQGIEFLYMPPQIFHHNATVYVHIELYDEAPDPNFIYTDYWFKIVPDYNTPYLVNLSPDRDEDLVAVDTDIYFEIMDDGAGVDIDSLEVFINSRMISPSDITTVKVDDNHYKVTCDLPNDLYYNKLYMVGVKVSDTSDYANTLRDSYRFYTVDGDSPWFVDFDPRMCRRGMPRFTDVSFTVLGTGHGVDPDTIRLQVHDHDVTDKSTIIPIIYRIS